jgi:hypothetical protein
MYIPKILEIKNTIYYHVEDSDNLFVNKEGQFIYYPTFAPGTIYFDKYINSYKINFLKNGKKNNRKVASILATLFIPLPTQDGRRYVVSFKDSDVNNVAVENLCWKTPKTISNEYWLNVYKNEQQCLDYIKHEYLLTNVNKKDNEFFLLPFSSKPYLINKNGTIKNYITGEEKQPHRNKYGYLKVVLRHNNKYKTYSVHRLVAMLFVPKPDRHKDKDFLELEVNHIDGNKNNNNYLNLEWVTTAENLDHAWETKLIDTGKRVLAKNLDTNEVIRFDSISKTAKEFNIREHKLNSHLNSIYAGMLSVNGYVFKLDNKLEWPNKIIRHDAEYLMQRNLTCLAFNVRSKKTYIFYDLLDACKELKINRHKLKYHKEKNGYDVAFNDFVFRLLDTEEIKKIIHKDFYNTEMLK